MTGKDVEKIFGRDKYYKDIMALYADHPVRNIRAIMQD
jgi:hypothetical protein